MISLFHIPTHVIDTSRFKNLLRDPIVQRFEERFAEYVGAGYAVSVHSATDAIFLIMQDEPGTSVGIPSILPPVVANALSTCYCDITFEDNVEWVGGSYILHQWADCNLIDSAQMVEKNQFSLMAKDKDIMFFSFFPTKPIGSCDGGMIVSNDKEAIETIRVRANNGMQGAGASWEKKYTSIGFKMYMNSISAWIANENMNNLERKKEQLYRLRDKYNKAFGIANTSEHLYRIQTVATDNRTFVAKAREAGIECGIHYDALHRNPLFGYEGPGLPLSDIVAKHTVSIPYHEMMDTWDANKVIEFVKRNG